MKRRKLQKDADGAVTVSFETTVDGKELTRTLIVLIRIEVDLRRRDPAFC